MWQFSEGPHFKNLKLWEGFVLQLNCKTIIKIEISKTMPVSWYFSLWLWEVVLTKYRYFFPLYYLIFILYQTFCIIFTLISHWCFTNCILSWNKQNTENSEFTLLLRSSRLTLWELRISCHWWDIVTTRASMRRDKRKETLFYCCISLLSSSGIFYTFRPFLYILFLFFVDDTFLTNFLPKTLSLAKRLCRALDIWALAAVVS